jgi:extracellular elastinolytic metalloproteinase
MLASLLASCGLVALVASHPTGHSDSLTRRAIDLNAFRLTATSKYVNATLVDPNLSLHRSRRGDYVDTATELVKSVVKGATFRVVGDHYVGSNGIAHVNFKQTANGLDIDNADFNINVSVSLSLLLPMLTVTRSLKMDPSFLMETPFSPALSPRTRLQSAISRIPSMH